MAHTQVSTWPAALQIAACTLVSGIVYWAEITTVSDCCGSYSPLGADVCKNGIACSEIQCPMYVFYHDTCLYHAVNFLTPQLRCMFRGSFQVQL